MREHVLDALDESRRLPQDDGFSQTGLVAELLVQQCARDADRLGDLAHAHPLPAPLSDQVMGSLQHRCTNVLAVALSHGGGRHGGQSIDNVRLWTRVSWAA